MHHNITTLYSEKYQKCNTDRGLIFYSSCSARLEWTQAEWVNRGGTLAVPSLAWKDWTGTPRSERIAPGKKSGRWLEMWSLPSLWWDTSSLCSFTSVCVISYSLMSLLKSGRVSKFAVLSHVTKIQNIGRVIVRITKVLFSLLAKVKQKERVLFTISNGTGKGESQLGTS